MKMAHLCLAMTVIVAPTLAAISPGPHLPAGQFQPVRERTIDVRHVEAGLAIDMTRQTVGGYVTVAFEPLRTGLTRIVLDAADLEVRSAARVDGDVSSALDFTIGEDGLTIAFPDSIPMQSETSVRIDYHARPDTGLYFFESTGTKSAEAWNYGEGGRHYNWLPLYNGTNDRFSTDFRVTVEKPYRVLGNGTLTESVDNDDGTVTWRWTQDEPIPNYLIALKIGQFVEVPLTDARVRGRRIPLSVWTHEGDEDEAAFAFARTPEMIEFFADLLDYDYVWDKYDQVTLRNFESAMETATMVGFAESTLNHPGGMADKGAALDKPYSSWNREDTISHEAAHHWFGNLVTCRSPGSIWLNESFASYLHTVWNGHAYGDDELTYQRWRYLRQYLEYVRESGTVRPLEYFHYDSSDELYTDEITYLKGALVLHMLRKSLGDTVFYDGLTHYLETHAFSETDSTDLERALEEVSGRNLDWFFEDWIRGGGGYPALEASHVWSADRREVDLSIEQVQAMLPFQDEFRLFFDVEVVTADGSRSHRVQAAGRETHVALPSNTEPLMVVVDAGNWLVADIHHDLTPAQLAYQLRHGDVAARLRAIDQLAGDYPRTPDTVPLLARVLEDEAAHWGVRQQAALALGAIGGAGATGALVNASENADPRIRRAVAIGLGRAANETSASALISMVRTDGAEEVIGAAAIALGKTRAPAAQEVLLAQIDRESRYFDVIRESALAGLAELEDAALADVFRRFTTADFNREVRETAIEGWVRSAPRDPRLPAALRELADDPDLYLRGLALSSLGELHRADDLGFLREYAERTVDPYLRVTAENAAATIAAFVDRAEEIR